MIPKEYYTCHYTKQYLRYTEYVLAKKGWLAIDGTYRHPISKIGKTINQSLVNGMRLRVNGRLVAISHKEHPHHSVYQKNISDVRKENNYTKSWLRVDLSKEAYIRMYKDLNMDLPNFENLNIKGSRKSNASNDFLDFLNVPDDRNHREVKIGKYFVDGLVNNLAIEFFGDFFHANPEIYLPEDRILGYNAQEKWQKDEKRLEYITENGYNILKVWENDWNKFKNNLTDKLDAYLNGKKIQITSLDCVSNIPNTNKG